VFLLVYEIHLVAGLLIDTKHGGQPLTANSATLAFDLGVASMTIGDQGIQLAVTNFLRHGSYEVIVVQIQNACTVMIYISKREKER
jgi:hypothetical protein